MVTFDTNMKQFDLFCIFFRLYQKSHTTDVVRKGPKQEAKQMKRQQKHQQTSCMANKTHKVHKLTTRLINAYRRK